MGKELSRRDLLDDPRDSGATCPNHHLPACEIIGHRGLRMNTLPGEKFRENTLDSFHEGFKAGASWVEFDVQVTQDGVPVIWHDDHIVTLGDDGSPNHQEICELSCTQFMSLATGQRLVRTFAEADSGELLPWLCDDGCRGIPATFADVLQHAPLELGFDVELKFFRDRPTTAAERQRYMECMLEVLREYAGNRRLFFSSFDPDACIDVKRMQQKYPVLFLTDLKNSHDDARRNNLEAAIAVARGAGLEGIVPCVDFLLPDLEQNLDKVKAAGLAVLTYGKANMKEEHIKTQILAGVAAVCTDRISVAVKALTARSYSNDSISENKDRITSKTVTAEV
ncbi:hypothetical protein CYMTET_36524 [Cymbomonas tetramitiformis]|uniref:glycerophosphodiester phosphodiesterase n=1 Tax=Cymbomonas tetramitiformis TaxID=36881 RepID=A0AAE0F7H4_9CHLO|nr:hypothetical protein CYMTET_36524 [Cymbomonas tetramitiformis]